MAAELLAQNPLRFTQWKHQSEIQNQTLSLHQQLQETIPIIGETRPLNLSPAKAKEGNLTIHDRLDQMTTATLGKQTGLGLSNHYQVAGPIRLSNRDFLEEFHKIYHRETKNKDTIHKEHLPYDLKDELIEQKIRDVAEQLMRSSHHELHSRMNQRSNQLRDYVDVQLQKNGHFINTLQEDVRRSQDRGGRLLDLSGSYSQARGSQHIQQVANDDMKTKALKKSLAHEINLTLTAQKIQCKPIEGHDLPLSELKRQTLRDIQGQEEFKAQLLEVENLDMAPNNIEDDKKLLSMLVPNQLKVPTMEFLDVEDIRTIKDLKPPMSQAQIDRENYEKVVEADRKEEMITEEQRQKTIKCLLKVLDFELKDVQDQALSIENHFQKNEEDLKNFESFLKKEENRIIMADIQQRMDQARKDLERCEREEIDESEEGQSLVEIADLMVENQLLLDKIDAVLGKPHDPETPETEESSVLSDSMIEKLFKKAQGKSKSTFKEAEIKVQFGRPVVKTFADNNKKQLTRSKSRRVASDVGVAIPAQKREAIQREKDDKKQTIKAKIESKVSPSKLQAKGKREGGRETSLNREIQHAMNKMAQVMQVAFRERANE